MDPVRITNRLSKAVDSLRFDDPVTHVYNPLVYARRSHRMYLERYAHSGIDALWLGMNPGPWGMAQTGVPFGEVSLVRDWMKIEAPVDRPDPEHPKRPVQGFACERSEVSGKRLWGWAKERFKTPKRFFSRFFVWNYCPLAFLEESGRNFTPDKLPREARDELYEPCEEALVAIVRHLEPKLVIGVGKFAETRAREALAGLDVEIGTVLHPSPASPIANRGWAPQAEKQLRGLGLSIGARR